MRASTISANTSSKVLFLLKNDKNKYLIKPKGKTRRLCLDLDGLGVVEKTTGPFSWDAELVCVEEPLGLLVADTATSTTGDLYLHGLVLHCSYTRSSASLAWWASSWAMSFMACSKPISFASAMPKTTAIPFRLKCT